MEKIRIPSSRPGSLTQEFILSGAMDSIAHFCSFLQGKAVVQNIKFIVEQKTISTILTFSV